MAGGFRVSVKADIAAINRRLGVIEDSVIPRATKNALNFGIREARKESISGVSKETGVAKGKLRSRIKTTPAKIRVPTAILRLNARGYNPVTLGLSPATAMLQYTGPTVGQAFFMTFPNNTRHIVVRIPKSITSQGRDSKKRLRKNRLPVHNIRIRIGQAAVRVVQRALEEQGREAFIDEYYRQIQKAIT